MLDQSKHRQIMVSILYDIYSDHELLRLLGFKGGTMAYLFYDLPRFSIDLDFDLLDINKEQLVFEKVKKILSKYGEVKQEDNKRYSLFFMLRYELGQHNIKVDINKRTFGSSYEVKNYLGIDILCMKIEDAVANKFVAGREAAELQGAGGARPSLKAQEYSRRCRAAGVDSPHDNLRVCGVVRAADGRGIHLSGLAVQRGAQRDDRRRRRGRPRRGRHVHGM